MQNELIMCSWINSIWRNSLTGAGFPSQNCFPEIDHHSETGYENKTHTSMYKKTDFNKYFLDGT